MVGRAEDPSRRGRHRLQRASERNDAGLNQIGDHRGERGLEPDRPGRRVVELGLLLLNGVRRVVGGDRIDRAVGQAAPKRVPILARAQRRVHLEVRVVRQEVVVGEDQVVGRDLGGDRQTLGLGRPHELDGAGARQVAQVEPAAGEPGDREVAGDDHLLGFGRLAREPQ